MTEPPLKCISIITSPDAEDALCDWLSGRAGVGATIYYHLESGNSTVSAYVPADASTIPTRGEIKEQVRLLDSCGLKTAPGTISIRSVKRENWAESWKRHFPPLDVGPFLLKPSWNQRRPKAGQHEIILDPGLSFGTGHHATTRFCLEQIAACRSRWENPAMLDIGPGSGLLAIAAAKLDYTPIDAFDFDQDSVDATMENCATNGVAYKVKVKKQDLVKTTLEAKRRYELVCANLIYDLLIQERERISNRVLEGGSLILAGILKTQFTKVSRSYAELGWKLKASKIENEWKSGRLERAG